MNQKKNRLKTIQTQLTKMLLQSPIKSVIDIAYWKQA